MIGPHHTDGLPPGADEVLDAAALIQRGQQLVRCGRRREALGFAAQAEQLELDRPELLDGLGTLLTHCEEPARALPLFARAVRGAPDHPGFRYNLAMAQRMTGDIEAAEENLDAVLAARPDDGEAYNARSGLRRQTPEHNHVGELEAVHGRLGRHRAAIPVAFALAKELEDLGDYSRAFAWLSSACTRYRAALRYDVGEDVAVMEALLASHTAASFATRPAGFESEECIFIVGLPRSGTTLVERILGSHTQVYPAGELDAFPSVCIAAVAQRTSRPVNKLEFVHRALELDFRQLGSAYIDASRPRTASTPRFTDKLPLNYLYAGLINAALPRARFVALRRHPVDSCYAMYKTLFAAAYPFTYDLMDLARYYVAWDRLMRHWRELIGRAWLEVSYEELIADLEGVSRRIIVHCGLEWEERCLSFHRNPAAVTSASAVQVRRPLYADSVGRWQAYARDLGPLARYLKENGVAY
jgi:tetratricopeptide (TPR) repeat protein